MLCSRNYTMFYNDLIHGGTAASQQDGSSPDPDTSHVKLACSLLVASGSSQFGWIGRSKLSTDINVWVGDFLSCTCPECFFAFHLMYAGVGCNPATVLNWKKQGGRVNKLVIWSLLFQPSNF